jgi:SNF2 family DNA or RNA helicase
LLLREAGLIGRAEARSEATKIKALERNVDGWLPEGVKEKVTLADGTKINLRETLTPAQQAGIKYIAEQKKAYLDFEAGSGKTLVYMASALHLRSQGKVKKCLISMPASVLQQFADEIKRFTDEKPVIVRGTGTSGRAAQYKGDQFFTLINVRSF